MESIFNIKLPEFIEQWAAVESIDKEAATALTKAAVKYYKHNGASRSDEAPVIIEQELRWYASLTAGTPDFSIYDEPLSNVFACWQCYSKHALKKAQSTISSLKDVSSVVDVGCGCGYSTAALKELLPHAEVFCTEFEGPKSSWKFVEQLGKERGFSVVHNVQELNRHIDLVFASEYFEHFADPIRHMRELLQACTPKYLVVVNSFNTRGAGHFILHKDINDRFWGALFEFGYRKVETGFFKEKPSRLREICDRCICDGGPHKKLTPRSPRL
jgi:SAM-dependent methyltransferase